MERKRERDNLAWKIRGDYPGDECRVEGSEKRGKRSKRWWR